MGVTVEPKSKMSGRMDLKKWMDVGCGMWDVGCGCDGMNE